MGQEISTKGGPAWVREGMGDPVGQVGLGGLAPEGEVEILWGDLTARDLDGGDLPPVTSVVVSAQGALGRGALREVTLEEATCMETMATTMTCMGGTNTSMTSTAHRVQ
eukprot:comp23285_c2_seq1/m.38169 comp23285_c2_seq1/g.38169  ORF comp23285_c2_seq1/g.38169 comp23285_c2_seq1/m.38169 type:complete len:109 (-) comp23285_c2_seq1:906-1232(-)